MRPTRLFAAVATATLTTTTTSVLALDAFNYGAFTQTAAYSIASRLQFFDAVNLNVTYLQIPNSTFGYNALQTGSYDILTGTIDNVVNLRFNSARNITVIGGADAGPDLVIASAANITDIQQLKGQPIIVDSPISGYAYLLRKVLSLHGLRLEDGDYYFQTVGSTVIRYQYLKAGFLPNGTAVVATILTYPFTAMAEATDLNILARVSDYVNPFASSSYTVAESSLASGAVKRDAIKRFLAAMYCSTKYLADEKNKNCTVRVLAKQYNVTSDIAIAEYEAATDPATGESSFAQTNLAVSRQGLLNVIDVRGQFGGFAAINNGAGFDFNAAIQPGSGKMIDYTIRDEVVSTEWPALDQLVSQGNSLCK